ncbi:uncharacterized protein PHALS_14969 [Plasmopara halstedii]|uniref:Uncharacterized protein n=1 Tax=Plasmopara halstedii TaxID=4781 RepID=A0A0P1B0W8_PLAHL|nr:uncharacterized protein PHALS_14969 [Plasmopara halstedii]CEG47161.1 hypothetical protein PHALS_14969 [Plasmopara halstedii]|eukprot:XP_024583530.1 hypothetical protein PHALS_14969 [Plasmopara halstedii]
MEIFRLLNGPVYDSEIQKRVRKGSSLSTDVKNRRKRRSSLKRLRDKNQRDIDSSLLLNLTLDVNNLRQQVHDCIMFKTIREMRLLVAREQFQARSLRLVDNFFHIFRHGHPGTFSATEESFLSMIIPENLVVRGHRRSRVEFLELWRQYKQLFKV